MKLMGFQGYVKFEAKNSTKHKPVIDDFLEILKKTSPETIKVSHQILGDYSYLDVIKGRRVSITIIK